MVLTWPSEKNKTTSAEWFSDNGGGNIPSKKDKSVKADCMKSDESIKKLKFQVMKKRI